MSAAAADDELGGNSAINDVQQPTMKSEEQSPLMSNNTPSDSHDIMYNNTNNDTNCNDINTTNTINEQQEEHRPSWRSSESSIQKERPAPLNSTTNSNNTTSNTTSNNSNNSPQPTIIGAHQINERAPNINRRFFRLAGPGRRERAREERAAARELAEQQQQQQQQGNNIIDVSNRIDNSNRNSSELNESDNSLLRRPIERTIQSNGSSNTGSNRPNLSTSGGVSSRNFLSRLGINTTNNEFRNSNNSDTVNLRSSNFTDDGHHPHTNNTNHNNNNDNLISATLVEDTNVILAQVVTDDDTNVLKPPESEVERIVQRLELRQHNKVSVPMEVKYKFLKLCNDAACKRRLSMNDEGGIDKGDIEEGNGDERSVNSWHSSRSSDNSSDSSLPTSMESKHGFNPNDITSESTSPYIHRSDLLQIRNTIRLTVESRSKYQRLQDSIKDKLGFRSHSKVLLHVLNRAVDMIDESLRVKESRRGSNLEASCVRYVPFVREIIMCLFVFYTTMTGGVHMI